MTIAVANGQIRKPTLSDALLLVLMGFVWGSAFLAIKIAVFETGPVLLVFLRILTALAPLWIYMVWRGASFPDNRYDWVLLVAMSLLNTVIPFFLLSWAGLHISSGVMALIMGLGPLLSLVVSHVSTHDDRFSMSKLLGMLIGLAGLALIIGGDALGGVTANLLGDLAVVVAITCYAVASAMVRKVRSTSKEAMATVNMIVSAAVLAPIVLLVETPALGSLSTGAVISILYLGVVTTGIGYLLRFHLVLTVGQTYMSMASYIMPVVGVGLGTVFLAEPLSANIVAALALVLASFAVARVGR